MKIRLTKKVLYCKALRCETIKNNKKVVFLMSNLQTYHFKLDFQKVDQYIYRLLPIFVLTELRWYKAMGAQSI